MRWILETKLPHEAQQIVLEEYRRRVEHDADCVDALTMQTRRLNESWRWAPVVSALQALRGVCLITAVTVVAEMGDLRRFAHPKQMMAALGLVPSEYSLPRLYLKSRNKRRSHDRLCGYSLGNPQEQAALSRRAIGLFPDSAHPCASPGGRADARPNQLSCCFVGMQERTTVNTCDGWSFHSSSSMHQLVMITEVRGKPTFSHCSESC